MKRVSQITNFYYSELHPVVEELEKKRKSVRGRIVVASIIVLSLCMILAKILVDARVFHQPFEAFFFFGIISLVAFKMLKRFFSKDYTNEFKERIIRPLVVFIDPNLRYNPTAYMPEADFVRANIVSQRIDKYGGDDYISGKIDGVDIALSDVYAQKISKDSKGNKTTTTLFRGIFIKASFVKEFQGKMVVLPDSAQSLFGSYLGNILQSFNFSRDDLVKMDDPEFEKYFVVYATDQIEARYILSHALMKRIVAFRKKVQHNISLSFIGGVVYIAVHYNSDSLEPTLFTSLKDYSVALEYIQTLYFALEVVNQLNLNSKIWSKS